MASTTIPYNSRGELIASSTKTINSTASKIFEATQDCVVGIYAPSTIFTFNVNEDAVDGVSPFARYHASNYSVSLHKLTSDIFARKPKGFMFNNDIMLYINLNEGDYISAFGNTEATINIYVYSR